MILKGKFIVSLGLTALTAALTTCVYAQAEEPKVSFQQVPTGENADEIKKLSEAFGHFIGKNLKNPGIDFDLESIIKGMRDGASGKPAPMSNEEYEQLMAMYQAKAYFEISDKNLKAANEFLEKNKNEVGVVALEEGKLQYKILQEGKGEEVKEDGSPQIHYTGRFLDGEVFGSTEQAKEPVTLPLTQTIPGFRLGVKGMKEGEKRVLFVHPDLGFGTGGQLPPNALLIFEIEVVKAQAPQQEEDDLSANQIDDSLEHDPDAYDENDDWSQW